MESIVIFGASGHAKVIIDTMEKQGSYKIAGILVDTPDVSEFMGYPVIGNISDAHSFSSGFVGIGDNLGRRSVVNKILSINPDFRFVTVIHPSAIIGRGVMIGAGTYIAANTVVSPHSRIGEHCIINTKASVAHDTVLGDYATLAPGVTMGGHVTIGAMSVVSLGANVIEKIIIGTNTLIGTGSTVIKNVPDNVMVYGTPAKVIRPRQTNEKYLR